MAADAPTSSKGLERVIVGHTQITRAIGGSKHESVMDRTREEFSAKAENDFEAAKMLMSFNGALKALEKEETNPSLLSSPQHQIGSLLQAYLADKALEEGSLDELPKGMGLEVRFDENDWLGWAGSFFTWAKKWVSGKHKIPPTQAPIRIQNDLSVGVIADWGTGLYGAPACGESLERGNHKILMHLGDVYYSGTKNEEMERFLNYWPKGAGSQHFALNSNHEMYTGGYGYFDTLLQDQRFRTNQSSSWFLLENDNFLFVGLDTAYEEHSMADQQIQWLTKVVESANGRKVVLFSHHQPFSLFPDENKAGEHLSSLLGPLLMSKKIFAWYFGHEHRCIIYDKHPAMGFYGRCLGHGGYPHFRDKTPGLPPQVPSKSTFVRMNSVTGPGALVLDGPNVYIQDEEDKYVPNGFVTLEIIGAKIHERFHDPNGAVILENDLV